MPAAVALRPDWDAKRVRAAAREVEDAGQVRRLLAIAAAYEGQDRAACAKIGAMDRQRLRDWVHRFNAAGLDGLIDRKPAGAARRLTPEQEAELAALVEAGTLAKLGVRRRPQAGGGDAAAERGAGSGVDGADRSRSRLRATGWCAGAVLT